MFNRSFLAFALLHLCVPVISVVFFGASPLWLLGNLVFAAAAVRTLHATRSTNVVVLLCLLSAVAFTLSLMLGTCYYMQGEGFNDAFFYHLNTGTLAIASASYAHVFYPALLGLLLAILAPAFISKMQTKKVWPGVPVLLLWIFALASNYPVFSLVNYQAGIVAEPDPLTPDNATTMPLSDSRPLDTTKPKKNIILIYAESLEAFYFDTEMFGALLPNITKLSQNAHRFTNLIQVRGTGWTIAGIVASQCGFPLKVSTHLASNSTMASVEKPYPNETCLADILTSNGYDTVFMGGASLKFAGKGNFLQTHGYKRISGYRELVLRLSDKTNRSNWGIYDDNLFEFALDEVRSLEKNTQPYLLTLLTLDTHHPDGLPSKSCNKLTDNPDSMSNAIYCSDQLISRFINDTMNIVDMTNTIIVLFSDHLSLRNTLWNKLKDKKQERRLTLMIFDDRPATVFNQHGTHFDVAPTILDAAGFAEKYKIGAGISLFSKASESQNASQAKQEDINAPSLLNPMTSVRESGVFISAEDMSITIGELTLKPNNSGHTFKSGMYLAVLNKQGAVTDAIYSGDYESLANGLNGVFVVGVSLLPGTPNPKMYFYGTLSQDGRGIKQRALYNDIHLDSSDLWPPQNSIR